eukprot:g44374.t1
MRNNHSLGLKAMCLPPSFCFTRTLFTSTQYFVRSYAFFNRVLCPHNILFAPTNAAFAAAGVDLSDARAVNAILKYHMLGTQFLSENFGAYQLLPTLMTDAGYVNLGPGMPQVVRLTASVSMHPVQLNWNVPGEAASTSTVSEADVLALNGVIHIVDKVLHLPPRLSAAAAATGTLSKLIAAWERTGLTHELEATPSLTIFALVDGGLARLGIDLDDLSNEDLRRLLLNHVVAGRVVYSNNFLDGQTLTTMLGEAASIKVLEGTEITVTAASGASAVKKVADVLMQNGVIHLIDGVLFPERFGPGQSIVTNLQQNADLSTLQASIVRNFADPAVKRLLQDVGRKLTLFAPTNAAFAAAGVDLSDARAVNAILKYHMLGTQFLLKDFGAYQLLPTLMTDAGYVNLGPGMPQVVRLTASVSMHPVQLNWNVPGEAASTSTVSEADLLALNGVIHIVDKVLQTSSAFVGGGCGYWHAEQTNRRMGAYWLGIDLDDLSNEDLRRMMLNHVTLTTMLGEAASIKVLEGTEIKVTAASGASAVKKVADVLMQNGVIHLIDGVLFPERFGPGQSIATNLQQNADLSTLASIVSNFADPAVEGLLQDVGRKLTLFAPTNAAFAAAGVDLSDTGAVNAILKYHMLGARFQVKDLRAYQLLPTLMTDAGYVNLGPGMPQVVRLTASVSMHPVQLNWNVPGEAASTSTVSEADVLALNGIIHIVDKVLKPPPVFTTYVSKVQALSMLEDSLERANLLRMWETKGALTIFAPTDEAFANAGVCLNSLSDEELSRLLLNHVVTGQVVYSVDFLEGQQLPTMSGEHLTITGYLNKWIAHTLRSGAGVDKAPDVLIQNGVVHVIDAVLLPRDYMNRCPSHTVPDPYVLGVSDLIGILFAVVVVAAGCCFLYGILKSTCSDFWSSGNLHKMVRPYTVAAAPRAA